MALQVWLPLNGNLNNQGLSNITVTNNGAALTNGGKLGKCYYFNGANYLIGNGPLSTATTEFSIAFWVKYDNLSNYHCMYSQRTVTDKGITVWKNGNHIRFDDGTAQWETSYVFTVNAWTHVTLTRNASQKKLYINGELKDTSSSSTLQNISTKFLIGKSSSNNDTTAPNANPLYGYLNDMRVYDHCLSPKEVKELSKGLILHYPLNKIYINLLPFALDTSNYSQTNYQNRTSSNITNGIYHVNGYQSDSSIDTSFGAMTTQYITLAANTVYYLSFYCKSKSASSLFFGTSGQAYTSFIGSSNTRCYPMTQVTLGTEFEGFVSLKIKTGTDTQYKINLGFDNPNIYGIGSFIEFSQVMITTQQPNYYTRYGDNNVYDCSGYGNNGTIGGTLTTNTDSSRYSASTVFNGSSYVNAGRGAMVRDEISVCCWAYMDSWSSYNARLMSCTETGGWNFEPASGKMNFACGTGASSNVYKSATGATALSALTSGWHQFVGTYDGFNTKIYIDGVLDGTNAAYTTKTPLFYNSTNAIFVGAEAGSSASAPVFNYFNGRLSDVRIYATALSADDIKELYDTSSFITNNGSVNAYEFVEETSSPQIFKSGVFKSTNISEYSNNLKILSDGSVWVRMLYHSTPSSNLFTESNCWNNDAANLYSRLGLLKDTAWKSSSGKYEFLVYEKLESSSTEGVYRWTQTSNPATATTASGYELISGSPAHLSPGICSSNGQHGAIDISSSDWWCCLGCYTAYQGGAPGFNGVVKSGYIDFYVRVPDVKMINEDKAILHSDNIQSKQIIEI